MSTTVNKMPKEVEDWLTIRMLGEPYVEMVEENERRFIRRGYIWNGKKYYEKEVDLKDINTDIGCLAPGETIGDVTTRPIEFISIPERNYSLAEMIEVAKNSEYGCVWYSDKGPIQITKEGELKPI